MAKTAVDLVENLMTAARVASELAERGFPLQFEYPGPLRARHAEFEVASARELERIGATRLEPEAYLNGLWHGGTPVIATSSDSEPGESRN